MKCDNCGHLCTEGYEYPESYCELGIPDNPKYRKYETGDGCSMPRKIRIKRCAELTEKHGCNFLWWNEKEDTQ